MQPARGQKSPPSAVAKYRNRTAGPKQEQALKTGSEKIKAAHSYTVCVGGQRQQIKNDAAPHDELREAKIAAQAFQCRRESPKSWIPTPAVKASLIIHRSEE